VATLAQIAAKDDATLTALERSKVREILAETFDTADAAWTTLETIFTALAAVQNQHVRAYIDDWDAIPIQPVELSGGARALTYDTDRHRWEVGNRIRRALGLALLAWGDVETDEAGWQVVNITLPTYTITEDAEV
jgi:hypothetical protein